MPDGFFRVGLLDYLDALQPYTGLNLALPSGTATTTHKLISRYDVDTGLSSLWVDAACESDTCASAVDTLNPTSIGYIGLRQDLGMGYIYIDDLMVTVVSKPNIASVSPPVGGKVDIIFAGSPGDTATSFTVEYAPALDQAFTPAEATIVALADLRFQAITAAPGVRRGMKAPPAPALLAVSGPATPSMAPAPNFSGCLDTLFSTA